MPNVTINLSKWYHLLLGSLPLLAMLATGAMWMDTRYMHKEISDTRFIELQIRIVQAQVRAYHKMVQNGERLTPEEQVQFDLDRDQLRFLMGERNRLLGLGDSEE